MALSYVTYTANGSTQQFDLTFSYIAQSHIKVYVDNVEDNSFTWINSSRIQTASMPSNGQVVKIERNTPTDARLVDFQDGSTLTETDLDKSANQNFFTVQENLDDISDCLKKDNTAVYDAGSVRIKNLAAPTSGSDAATKTYIDTQTTSAATSATNAASSATAAASSATSAASSATSATSSASTATTKASEASTSATNAASSATAAASSASTASGHATTATTKASEAATSATNASTSASTASTQATNAASSATASASSASSASTAQTAAETAKTAAETAKTAAETAKTAAETALDTFDDKFLGSKSSNPTVDNDGATLTDGALYFNTTDNVMKVYDLGNTTWKQLTPTSSQQTNIDSAVSNATNINTVATNIAGVNSFAERYRVDSSDPSSSLDEGDLVYNSTSNQVKYYNGSAWVAISADTDVKTLVSANDTTAGYLNGKLVAGSNVTFTENSDGGNETLTIAAADNSIPFSIALG